MAKTKNDGMAGKFLNHKLLERRKKRDLSVVGLARIIDPECPDSLAVSIHGYEAGRNLPSCVMLFLLAKALKCRMEYFMELVESEEE